VSCTSRTSTSCHAQPLLKSLHWLPISQRIDFKLATLAYKTRSTFQPKYLRQLISSQLTGSTMSLVHLHVLSFRFHALELYTAAVLLAQLSWPSGTICRLRFWKRTVCQLSAANSRCICLLSRAHW